MQATIQPSAGIDWKQLVCDLADKLPGGITRVALIVNMREVSVRPWANGDRVPNGAAQVLLLKAAKKYLPDRNYATARVA